MNIVIFGGSGFIGTAVCKELIQRKHTVTSISRHGQPDTLTDEWARNVHWLHSDILNDTKWQTAVKEADWVIDAIGILKEDPAKNNTYDRFIVEPIKRIAAFLSQQTVPAKCLFLSANNAPFPFQRYMQAKREAEKLLNNQTFPHTIIYPSLVMDQQRPTSVLGGKMILFFKKIPVVNMLLKKYAPITRQNLANEIANVVEGQNSLLTQRRG
jgi:uncharacterized protein YbjT (DUF2867 family)